jgi:hypothetical protein
VVYGILVYTYNQPVIKLKRTICIWWWNPAGCMDSRQRESGVNTQTVGFGLNQVK